MQLKMSNGFNNFHINSRNDQEMDDATRRYLQSLALLDPLAASTMSSFASNNNTRSSFTGSLGATGALPRAPFPALQQQQQHLASLERAQLEARILAQAQAQAQARVQVLVNNEMI